MEQQEKEKAKMRAAKKKELKKKAEPEAEPAPVQNKPAEAKKKEKATQKSAPKRSRGKKYSLALKKAALKKVYSFEEAIKLLKEISFEGFSASVEIHLNLVDKDVKGEVRLPHGTGKELRVAEFGPEVETKIQKNQLDFDILLAKPEDMKSLVKYAKMLGPKGLMPSPKKGTLVEDLNAAKKKLAAGNIHYKSEPKFPLLHQVVGKVSFGEKELLENMTAFLKSVGRKNIDSAFVKTTMSPSLKLDISALA